MPHAQIIAAVILTRLPAPVRVHLAAYLAGYAPHSPEDRERARAAYEAAKGVLA